jgi:hypothetical protein
MQNLITPTGLRIAGRWLQPGDAVPGDVVGFDYEKAARKGMIEDTEGDEIENLPLPGQVPVEPSDADLGELFNVREELRQEREARAADQRRAEDRYAGLSGELANIRTEAQGARVAQAQDLERVKAEGEAALVKLREEHAEALATAEAKALPVDALERLIAIKGVGDKLAPVILAALQEPAPAPEQKD